MTPLLFIKHKGFNARTVENDVLILSEKFSVEMYEVNTTKGAGFFIALIKQLFWLLLNIYRYKVVFIWFADYHSLLPVFFAKLFGKICIINIGGYDADEILPGSPKGLKEKFRKFCVTYSVKNCTKLFAVSEIINSYLQQAVPAEKIETIYCCVDTLKFVPAEIIPLKKNIIITVGGGGEFIKEAKRKRLDFFIKLGEEFTKRYPEYEVKFYAIGHNEGTETLKFLSSLINSENVEIKVATSSVEELIEYYKTASIYMQLSYYEAFGIAQVEAMLYGCIPVSNKGGAIAEVIGNAGFAVKDYNMEEYLRIIKEILDKKHENLRIKARERAEVNFSLTTRKEKLFKVLNNFKV
ncbi:MAG: glycosyltransferase [Ignavibacteria bacterium]|nr:glycosyltransferase [Ignavibacteria bacterium]